MEKAAGEGGDHTEGGSPGRHRSKGMTEWAGMPRWLLACPLSRMRATRAFTEGLLCAPHDNTRFAEGAESRLVDSWPVCVAFSRYFQALETTAHPGMLCLEHVGREGGWGVSADP